MTGNQKIIGQRKIKIASASIKSIKIHVPKFLLNYM